MLNQVESQGTITKTLVDDYLLTWMEALLVNRKARGLADILVYKSFPKEHWRRKHPTNLFKRLIKEI